MNTNFTYQVPTTIYFGDHQLGNLGEALKRYGKRVLLIYGGGSIKRTGLYGNIIKEINKAGLKLFELSGIEPNPRMPGIFFRKGSDDEVFTDHQRADIIRNRI